MSPIRCILHPNDLSERSANAWRLACTLAGEQRARLVVLHVESLGSVDPSKAVPGDSDALAQTVDELLHCLHAPDSVPHIDRRVEWGNPAMVILQVAQEIGADLIVMGTHGRTGLPRSSMGSVAREVVGLAGCPVIAVTGHLPIGCPQSERLAHRQANSAPPAVAVD